MRLFVSVDVPAEVGDRVKEAQQFFKRQSLFEGTFTAPDQAHMTIAFLGDIDEDQLPAITAALQKVSLPQCEAKTGRLNYFERRGRPTVIFLLLICLEMIDFAARVHEVLVPWYTPKETRFIPHVTIARVKSVQDHEALAHAIEEYEVPECTFDMQGFALKESELTPEGPVHRVVRKYTISRG